jgi:hypothetical protein
MFDFRRFIKKGYSSTLDKNAFKCGFLDHIRRTIKTYKQTEQSVYVFFCLLKTFLKNSLSNMQQTALSCRDLVRKEIKEQDSLPFMARKGVRNHEAIFFSDYHRKSV